MLDKFHNAIRIQRILKQKGFEVSPLEAFDAWTRYSNSVSKDWVEMKNKDSDETIYRRVRNYIVIIDSHPFEMAKILHKLKEKIPH
jgi:tRNA uridine 5-carbamoylmethylation protein Kti12